MEITDKLIKNQDIKYQKFTIKLIPNIDPNSIIGVRVPVIRKLAKDFINQSECMDFLNSLPHKYYEENMLHAILLSKIKEYDKLIYLIDKFLPYVDNWAVCDTLRPKYSKENLDNLENKAYNWIESSNEYTIRYGIGTLMIHFLKDNFKEEYLEKVSNIKDDRYYVKMMIGWFFTESLFYHFDETIPYIKENKLSNDIRKITIRKCLDSYKFDNIKKDYLKGLR